MSRGPSSAFCRKLLVSSHLKTCEFLYAWTNYPMIMWKIMNYSQNYQAFCIIIHLINQVLTKYTFLYPIVIYVKWLEHMKNSLEYVIKHAQSIILENTVNHKLPGHKHWQINWERLLKIIIISNIQNIKQNTVTCKVQFHFYFIQMMWTLAPKS